MVVSRPEQELSLAARIRPAALALSPVFLVLAGLLFVFRGALLKGLVFHETDTLTYYYPVFSELHRALQQGTLPLWTPYFYGGFPLFADGESGALYPINLLLLLLTSPEGALLWLGPIRLALASFFMYLYVRTIGPGRIGALVSALVFGFGGFTIAQLHHVNLSNGALWLPLILYFVEKAYRQNGAARVRAVLFGAVVVAIQGLALHVQVSLMTILFLAFYVGFRALSAPLTSLFGKLRLGVGVLLGTVSLGLGLVAVQWIPLLELSRFSPRADGLQYSQAIEYSLPPFNLITLISPYFFRGPQRVSWTVWSSWETAIYVGIAPLLLAAVALLWTRNRWTNFFGCTALLSLLVAMANYLPFNLHYLLYRLPWFDAMRAPGRFSYLFTFSMACLAGFGAHWLASRHDSSRPRGFLLAPVGLAGLVAAVVGLLRLLREWLNADQLAAAGVLKSLYMGLGTLESPLLRESDVFKFLVAMTDIRNWYGPLGLSVASAALLLAWGWMPRRRSLIVIGLPILVAADLFWFAQDFHPTLPVTKLAEETPFTQFLAGKSGGERAFNLRTMVAAPNRLTPFGVQAAGGYSSLPFTRHTRYARAASVLERPLLDLWNVRYVITTSSPWGEQYYGVVFDPGAPLIDTGGQSGSTRSLYSLPDVETDELRMVSALHYSVHIPQGAAIGNIVLTGPSGIQQRIPILAGLHTAEAAYDRADVRPVVQHQKAARAALLFEPDLEGRVNTSDVYYAVFQIPLPATVRQIGIEYTYPSGALNVYGVSLLRNKRLAYQVRPMYRDKYRQVYQDRETTVYENTGTLPRVFLVPKAVSMPGGTGILPRLSSRDFDPLSEVLIEEPAGEPMGTGQRAQGRATITDYQDQRVLAQVETGEPGFLFLGDSYYPGWKAYVDGQEVPVYRANYLFRAVPVPGGQHAVEFRYQPGSFSLGLWLSGAVAAVMLLVGLATWMRGKNRPSDYK